MADLARHRIVFQHVPWVRYALYYMLMAITKHQLCVRGWSIDESKSDISEDMRQASNEDAAIFNHLMLGERRLVTRMATDKCSAARLLYSNALHSLRVLLLCEAVAYAPPYLQTSSFRTVQRKLFATVVVATHSSLDAVYRAMFNRVDGKHQLDASRRRGAYVHAAYDILLKRLQSKLGRMVVDGCEIYVLLNLTLLHLDLPAANSTSAKTASANSASANSISAFVVAAAMEFEIEGVQIPADLLQKLIVGRDTTAASMLEILKLFRSTDIYWSSTIWLLFMLRTAYEKFTPADLTASDRGNGNNTFLDMRTEIILLCSSPFQPYVSPITWVFLEVPASARVYLQ
ncbi:hypothetical protein GGI21_005462 [Coemansia aciculifera]|nr:hypothetical protein GGI21_005462 [Coemansia aciculifera]